uniref:Uncharacterized protein n=1 Tax=Cacopsylla melanoneura TaxID=428564 RepID=A0A8D9BV41_9HEMI
MMVWMLPQSHLSTSAIIHLTISRATVVRSLVKRTPGLYIHETEFSGFWPCCCIVFSPFPLSFRNFYFIFVMRRESRWVFPQTQSLYVLLNPFSRHPKTFDFQEKFHRGFFFFFLN